MATVIKTGYRPVGSGPAAWGEVFRRQDEERAKSEKGQAVQKVIMAIQQAGSREGAFEAIRAGAASGVIIDAEDWKRAYDIVDKAYPKEAETREKIPTFDQEGNEVPLFLTEQEQGLLNDPQKAEPILKGRSLSKPVLEEYFNEQGISVGKFNYGKQPEGSFSKTELEQRRQQGEFARGDERLKMSRKQLELQEKNYRLGVDGAQRSGDAARAQALRDARTVLLDLANPDRLGDNGFPSFGEDSDKLAKYSDALRLASDMVEQGTPGHRAGQLAWELVNKRRQAVIQNESQGQPDYEYDAITGTLRRGRKGQVRK